MARNPLRQVKTSQVVTITAAVRLKLRRPGIGGELRRRTIANRMGVPVSKWFWRWCFAGTSGAARLASGRPNAPFYAHNLVEAATQAAGLLCADDQDPTVPALTAAPTKMHVTFHHVRTGRAVDAAIAHNCSLLCPPEYGLLGASGANATIRHPNRWRRPRDAERIIVAIDIHVVVGAVGAAPFGGAKVRHEIHLVCYNFAKA